MNIARRIGLAVTVLLGGGAIAIAGAILFLNTGFAHRYMIRLATERLQKATGGRVEIGGFSFHRGRLGADFYRIKIFRDASDAGTPVFSADRASVDVGLRLFQARKVGIENVTIDQLAVHLNVDAQGEANLPHPAKTSGSSTNLFNLAVRHFTLNAGEVFYNDRRIPVTADVRDLNARAAYATLPNTYDAVISYRDARVWYGRIAPFSHDLQLSLEVMPSGLTIKSLYAQSGPSWIKAQGQLTNYAAPSLQGSYQASVATKELRNILNVPAGRPAETISGQVDAQGKFAYRNNPGVATIANIFVDGTLKGHTLSLEWPDSRLAVQTLTGDFALNAGTLQVQRWRAELLGGHVTGELRIADVTAKADAQLQADAEEIDPSAVRSVFLRGDLSRVRVDGRLGASIRATWRGGMKDLQLAANTHLAGTVSSTANPVDSFPVSGEGDLTYNRSAQIVTVRNGTLNTPRNHVIVQGSLESRANLNVIATSNDLHEADLLALLFRTGDSATGGNAAPELLGLSGSGSFTGTINGQLSNPRFAGKVTASHLRVRGTSVQSLQSSFEASANGIAARQGEVTFSPQSRASFDISVGLRDWHFTPQQPLEIRVNAARVSAGDLENVTGIHYPVSGLLNAAILISGTAENPVARGNIQLTQASLWQQPVQDLSVAFQQAGTLLVARLYVQAPAGAATGNVTFNPGTKEYDLQVSSPAIGMNGIPYLEEWRHKFSGNLSLSARGHGNLKDPQLEVTIGGRQLQVGPQKIEDLTVQASVARQRAQFDAAFNISGTMLRATGAVNLTGDYQATAKIDSPAIHLHSLAATFLPEAGPDLQGETEIHGTLAGPLKDPGKIVAHLQIPSLKIGYPELELAATSPIHIDYQQDLLVLQPAEFKGTGTDVTVQATVPRQPAANLLLKANGTVDIQLLEIWNQLWRTSGQVKMNVAVQGTRAHPEVKGTLDVSSGTIAITGLPTLEKMNGELDVVGERIQVKNLQGLLGGGPFEVHGFATYSPNMEYNLGVTAKNVRLFYPEGVRSQISARLNFTGRQASANLTGEASVDSLSLMQSFDLGSFAGQFNAPSAPSTGILQNIKLNIGLSSGRQLQLASNQLSMQGTADLRVVGTVADPVLLGRTNLTSGEFFFNGRRFEIQNASIEFANPVRTQPVVNLTATTDVNEFNITINVVGPFDRLRTTYTSDPPLSPVDVINLLITGQTTEAAQNTTSTPQSVIAGQLAGQVSDRLQKLTGISSLTIDPQLGGNQGNGASQLAIQERVTKNLFFTFATDVTTTQGALVQVEYQFSRKYSVSAIRDQTGSYQLEIKSRKAF